MTRFKSRFTQPKELYKELRDKVLQCRMVERLQVTGYFKFLLSNIKWGRRFKGQSKVLTVISDTTRTRKSVSQARNMLLKSRSLRKDQSGTDTTGHQSCMLT